MPFIHLTPRRLRTPVGLTPLLVPAAGAMLSPAGLVAVPVLGTLLGMVPWRGGHLGRLVLSAAGVLGVASAAAVYAALPGGFWSFVASALVGTVVQALVILAGCEVAERGSARHMVGSVMGLHLVAFPIAALVAPAYLEDRLVVLWTVLATWITWATLRKLRAMEEESLFRARRDGLTGLLNHGAFWDTLEEELRKGQEVSVILLDLDNFKRLNDTFGHRYGDRVLQGAAEILRKVAPDGSVIARYGGEEFGVILPGVGLEVAESLAWEVVRAAREELATTVSIGVASGKGSAQDLVARADAALYEAKRSGKDRVVVSGEKHGSVVGEEAAR